MSAGEASVSGRETILEGANPALTLYDGDERTAHASVWEVGWSIHGTGAVLVLWTPDRVRLFGTDAVLAHWLERDFTRHFPSATGLAWPEPTLEQVPVQVMLDMADGLQATADDVVVRVEGALAEREVAADDIRLDGVRYGVRLVLAPCRSGSITVAGTKLRGKVRVGGSPNRPESSAFITTSEVWTR